MTDPHEILTRAIIDNDISDSVWETLHIDDARRFATAQLAALDAAGLQIAPKTATEEMCDAAINGDVRAYEDGVHGYLEDAYALMCAAARKPVT